MSLPPLVSPADDLTVDEVRRYSRHLIIPDVGVAGQKRLKNAKVLCVGAGGLGSPALMYLAAAGVGTLGIVEFDTVDESNLQRQIIHGQSDTVVKAEAGQKSADHWRIANECQTSTNPYAPSPCASYAGCPSDKPVVYCSIGGLDHALWDSAPKAAWSFFDSL